MTLRPPLLTVSLLGLLAACAGETSAVRPIKDLTRLPISGLLQNGRFDVGPKPARRPEGFVVPRDEEQLREWLVRSDGPPRIWLPERTWHGDWTIERTVELRGAGAATVLQGSGRGTVVELHGHHSVVANLTVRGAGSSHLHEDSAVKARGQGHRLERLDLDGVLFGAVLNECHDCVAERLHVRGIQGEAEAKGDGIKLWESHGSSVRHCLVENVRDVVVWYSRNVLMDGNVVRGSRYGTHFMYAHDARMLRSALLDNVVGVFVMYSERLHVEGNVLAGARGAAGVGLGFKDSDDITVTGNWLVANTVGSYLDSSPRDPKHPVLLADNVLALNQVALRFHSQPHGVTLRDNDLVQNAEVAQIDGGGDATTVEVSGNYWSDYAGFDLDGDGVGDVAHEIRRLSAALTDAHPALQVLRGTAALASLDVIAQAVPVLTSQRLLIDASPRMQTHHAMR
jgi:nitrous oxidase accessory protein